MYDDDAYYAENQPRECGCRYCRSGGWYHQFDDCLWFRAGGDHRGGIDSHADSRYSLPGLL